MADWQIERLAGHHDHSDFACGHPSLDAWLKQYAGQYERRDLARTYVLVRPPQPRIVGYYAISGHRLTREIMPADQVRKLPRGTDVPALLLGRLAVDASHRGQGLGGVLLIDALRRVQHLADRVGIAAVAADAIDEKAVEFYLHHQFIPLLDDPKHLFLPVATIRKLGLDPMAE